MKPTYGIPCNETRYTLKAEKDRIRFRFVSGDGNAPSSVTVKIGDTDPLTGKKITDMTVFEEYHKIVNHEVYTNWKDIRRPLTPGEKKQREEKKAAVIADFEKRFGYRPSASDIHWLVDDFMPDLYTASIERYRDEEDNPESDRISGLGIPCEDPFGEDTPEEILRLREIAGTLTGRLADVYEAMLIRYAGGKERITTEDLARKWNVSISQIGKDRAKIIRMIKDGFKADKGKETE